MKLLSERLKWAMTHAQDNGAGNISPADIARAAKASNTTANYWLHDVNGIGAAKARLVGAYLGVNPIWLETGNGDPLQGVVAEPKKATFPDTLNAKCETADELDLLTMFRHANDIEREMLKIATENVRNRLREEGRKRG